MTEDSSDYSVRISAGEYIFREGDSGDAMFIIQEGQVEVLKTMQGREVCLTVLEEGDFFGEMAVLERLPRSASARAVTDCLLLRIDESTFEHMIRANPEIPVRMLRKLSQRLRHADAMPSEAPPAPAEATIPTAPLPAPQERSARLVHVPSGVEFALVPNGETSIGRYDAATGFQPEVDLKGVDDRRSTSRRHARIVQRDHRFFLREEVGSANGTFVGGQRLVPGVEAELHDGDEVRFGFVRMIFRTG